MNARITRHSAAQALFAVLHDVGEFVADNPFLVVALIVLAIIVFRVTRPTVH